MREGRPLIVIADDDEKLQFIIQDHLSFLEPEPEFIRVQTIEALLQTVHLQEVDLITLDIAFSADRPNREGLDALPRLVKTKPRVPVVVVSGNLNVKVVDEAKDERPQVQGVVEKGQDGDFEEELMRAARKAIAWGQAQRRQADALFEQAESAVTVGNDIDAARLFILAYNTGDLSGRNRLAFRERLGGLLSRIQGQPDLLADAYRALMEHCFDNNDEVGVIYYAKSFMELFPRYVTEAKEWLALTAEIGNKVYEMVDERLDLTQMYRTDRNYQQVIRECHLIQEKLANVFESYQYEAEAYRALGRFDASIEAYFTLADMAMRNGELAQAVSALEAITMLDREKQHAWRVQQDYDHIKRLKEQVELYNDLKAYPLLLICGNAECRREAEESNGFYRINSSLPDGECDVCGAGYAKAPGALAGKTITIIGGRFGRKYEEAILRLGAKSVLHHDAIHELHRIPALISPADAVLIVTGYASHAGTIKAERELVAQPRPYCRVHFYGVKQVVRGLIIGLLPELEHGIPA